MSTPLETSETFFVSMISFSVAMEMSLVFSFLLLFSYSFLGESAEFLTVQPVKSFLTHTGLVLLQVQNVLFLFSSTLLCGPGMCFGSRLL